VSFTIYLYISECLYGDKTTGCEAHHCQFNQYIDNCCETCGNPNDFKTPDPPPLPPLPSPAQPPVVPPINPLDNDNKDSVISTLKPVLAGDTSTAVIHPQNRSTGFFTNNDIFNDHNLPSTSLSPSSTLPVVRTTPKPSNVNPNKDQQKSDGKSGSSRTRNDNTLLTFSGLIIFVFSIFTL